MGIIIGESTSREFRLAVTQETLREQDIIAVDADLRSADGDRAPEPIRIWAKVTRIERINPLFPAEAGHELAATRTNPFDTVLSLTREMVSAVCQVLGYERRVPSQANGRAPVSTRLEQLRYPPQPASSAYAPSPAELARIVVGELEQRPRRALDIATLANRPDVDVLVDGHVLATRHLAVLAMTGAGKSWTVRRIVEQLAEKHFPMVIFDPHGDYTGLADLPALRGRVRRYYARFPVFEEEPGTVMTLIEALSWELANTHKDYFDDVFRGAEAFLNSPNDEKELAERRQWLSSFVERPSIAQYGLQPDLYFLADFAEAVVRAGRNRDQDAMRQIVRWSGRERLRVDTQVAGWLDGLPRRIRRAAARLRQMERISYERSNRAQPLPTERQGLVQYGTISIVTLAGYPGDLQATIFRIIAEDLFEKRTGGQLQYPVLFVLEEAHTFAPARAESPAEQQAILTTRTIAQEGRKFGIGLILISQRPSRLDETTLSQCNSYIIMRMVNPADQQFVRRVVESLSEDEASMLPNLDVGEAILAGQFVSFPVLARIKPPESQGEREERDIFDELEAAHRLATSAPAA